MTQATARVRWPVLTVLTAMLIWPPRPTQAASYQLRESATDSMGTAFAGARSAAESPATAFDNPAGLTRLSGLQIYLGGSVMAPSLAFEGSAVNAFGQTINGAGTADGGHTAFIPYAYVTQQVTPSVWIGLSLTEPFGQSSYYGPDFVGRYQGEKARLRSFDINPVIAWKVTDWLSLGAGISVNQGFAEFSTAINSSVAAAPILGRLVPLADGLGRVRSGTDLALGYNVGALFTVDDATRIGLSYRSRIQHDLSGTNTVSVPYPLSQSPAFASGQVSTKMILPDTAGISLTHVFDPAWTGYAELSWTNWSLVKSLTLTRANGTTLSDTPLHDRNTVQMSLGASYQLSQALTVRGGVGIDLSPVIDAHRTTSVPDSNRYLVAVGAGWRVLPRVTLDVAYLHVFTDTAPLRQVSATGDVLSGHTRNSIDVGSLGVRMAF